MVFAIALMILSGATAKLLNKVSAHRVSIYTVILLQNVGGTIVCLASLFFLPHAALVVSRHYYLTVGINIFLWPLASILTFYGIRHTQVSTRESLIQSRLIFIPIIAALFLGEHITLFAAVGTLLVFAGILVAVYKPELSLNHPDMHGFGYVLLASLVIAVTSSLDKYNVEGVDYLYYGFLIYVFQVLFWLFFLTKERRQELTSLSKHTNLLIVFSGSLVAGVFYIMQLWLYRVLPLHIAYPFIQLASASALLLAIIFLKERDRIPLKILGFCIAALGAFILRLGF